MKLYKKITIASLALTAALFLEGYRENRQLEKSYYTIHSNKVTSSKPIKIAQVSDTQFPRLRVSMDKLINAISNEKPDMIFYTGDTIDRTETIDETDLTLFLKRLTQIAPTFVVSGNHETTHPDYKQWLSIIENSDAILLENEVKQMTVNKDKVNVVGLSNDSTQLPKKELDKIDNSSETLVLAHHPEKMDDYSQHLKTKGFTVFSGHAHGGQIIIPGIGGVLSPDQGFFPDYADGLYQVEDNHLVVSRGLANSSFPARINNYPHLIFTTISNEKADNS
ncbi:MAG: metallophosphoesterase [Vagococcus sp.]